ncbi:beta-N-acetylhexosaminidase [Poseidonocella sedimentorum]|uniref:beta-N-acetylhexosaminidase n=1 Tax=Poseidonocella sedimentorum TaxID=871652 RepID=A0A1I6DG05_9RHOB|nr:beta-N-acetylhexosaminidase [Poseidonocella sedimentorum]SFR04311.1 beta-N-acetylhexosaminidase [Poseidonocella sedimentorum]
MSAAPRAVILDAEGPRLTEDERRLFAELDPWGFILFARNAETPDQLRALTDEMRSAVGRDAPIMIDQEGGRVQRLGPPHWRAWPAPLDHVVAAGRNAACAMRLRHRIIAAELRAVGIDMNCAPTLDIACDETHPFLRNRCFGTEPESVAEYGGAAAEGLLQGGVLPIMKHLPGHGRATQDSHADLPEIHASLDALRARDFAPFRALCDLPCAMTAHIVLPGGDGVPATLSPEAIRLIREEIGFGGLLMSDDLSMGAVPGSVAQKISGALAAGCDLALLCNASLADRRAAGEAAPPLSAMAEARAEAALALRQVPSAIDIRALEAELESLMQ